MAVEAVDMDLRGLPPYSAVCWSQFEANPRIMYGLVKPAVRPGQNYESDCVFDLTGAKRSVSISELKVENVEDLHRLSTDLLRMPLLFRVKVEHTRTDHYVVMKVRKRWRDEFAILVNTQHPQIREVLSRRLSEAMQYMQDGKNFCIKIGFGHSVRQWYSGVVDAEVSLCDRRSNSDDGNMNIYIHNYSTPMDCCVHPLCIMCCFPFWLLCGGPCYLTHRKCIADVTDVEEHVTDLPVTMLTGQRVVVIQHNAQQGPGPQMQPQGPPQYTPGPQGQYPGQYGGPQGQYPGQYGGPQGQYPEHFGGQPGQYPGQNIGPHGPIMGPGASPPPYSAI